MIAWTRAWPVVVALAWPMWPAWAQTPPPEETTERKEALERWRRVNEAVSEFPRGHADLLRLERSRFRPLTTAPPDAGSLTADEAVRRALRLRPDLFGPSALNPVSERKTLLAQTLQVTRAHQAWLDAVLAAQILALQQARSEVSDNGVELGKRMVQAGNWSQARLLREQVTQTREALALLQAQRTEGRAREVLARELGVDRVDDVNTMARHLPAALPVPPAQPPTLSAEAVEAQVLAADTTQAQTETERRSQAREAWNRLLNQHAQAHQTETVLLPLVTAQEQETLLRYNGMLQSTWELLDATRERIAVTAAAAQARHAYWTAWLDWQLLLAGGPYRATATDAPSATADTASKDH